MSSDTVEARASQGDVEAQCTLALLYELGLDREVDLAAAKRWWHVAAKAGNAWAQLRLAKYFRAGSDKQGDLFAESQWLAKAEEQGFVPRQAAAAALLATPALSGKIILGIYEGPLLEVISQGLSAHNFDLKLPNAGRTIIQILAENPDAKLVVFGLDFDIGKSLPTLRTLNTLRSSVPIVIISQKIPRESVAQWQHLQICKWLGSECQAQQIASEILNCLGTKRHG